MLSVNKNGQRSSPRQTELLLCVPTAIMSAMHLMGSGLAHAPMSPCAATFRASPALPVRSSQPACTSSRAALHCRGISKSFGSLPLLAIRPSSRCVNLQAGRGCFDLSASECRNAPNMSRRKIGACRPVAASSAAPIDPNFPAPAAPRSQLDKVADVLTTLFPVWVCLGASIGIARPQSVAWCSSGLFTSLLGFLMLSMGLTLTFEDFKKCAADPVPIGVGYLAQYIVKPLLGYAIAKILNLSPALATGLILVSCCPGGQSSNVATYIAHGDVALSVLMTTASTLGAIVMTPLLTKTLAGALISVDAVGLAVSTFQVVLVPTLVGVIANEFFHDVVKKFTAWLPLVGVAITTLLCASPCAQVATVLRAEGVNLLIPVAVLHFAAFTMGYWLSKGLKFNEKTARTVSIETGMQSAALGFALAQKHFPDPMVSVPAAVSVVFMALGGSALAVFWRSRPVQDTPPGGQLGKATDF